MDPGDLPVCLPSAGGYMSEPSPLAFFFFLVGAGVWTQILILQGKHSTY